MAGLRGPLIAYMCLRSRAAPFPHGVSAFVAELALGRFAARVRRQPRSAGVVRGGRLLGRLRAAVLRYWRRGA